MAAHSHDAPIDGAESQLWYARAALADPLSHDDETLRAAANIVAQHGTKEEAQAAKRFDGHASKRRFDDLPPAQQAGMLCNDEQFQRFANLQERQTNTPTSTGFAAEFIRTKCGIRSRKQLNENQDAAARFAALRTDFDAWRGKIQTPR